MDLLAAFRRELASTDELVVVGYSFRDEHINEYVKNWLAGSTDRTIVIVDPNATKLELAFAKVLLSQGPSRVFAMNVNAGEGLSEVLQPDRLL